jgi:hypothetical protein
VHQRSTGQISRIRFERYIMVGCLGVEPFIAYSPKAGAVDALAYLFLCPFPYAARKGFRASRHGRTLCVRLDKFAFALEMQTTYTSRVRNYMRWDHPTSHD